MAPYCHLRKARRDLQRVSQKSRPVYVEGRLRTREFEARNNGRKRQRTEVVASRVQYLRAPPADAVVWQEPIVLAEDVSS